MILGFSWKLEVSTAFQCKVGISTQKSLIGKLPSKVVREILQVIRLLRIQLQTFWWKLDVSTTFLAVFDTNYRH